ncbi:unnamed protein product, partial [Urochloa humidicola]
RRRGRSWRSPPSGAEGVVRSPPRTPSPSSAFRYIPAFPKPFTAVFVTATASPNSASSSRRAHESDLDPDSTYDPDYDPEADFNEITDGVDTGEEPEYDYLHDEFED